MLCFCASGCSTIPSSTLNDVFWYLDDTGIVRSDYTFSQSVIASDSAENYVYDYLFLDKDSNYVCYRVTRCQDNNSNFSIKVYTSGIKLKEVEVESKHKDTITDYEVVIDDPDSYTEYIVTYEDKGAYQKIATYTDSEVD
jgi:hypothetical protein